MIGRLTHRPTPISVNRPGGFSLLGMMMVVPLISIVASIATPIYRTCAVRAREAVLPFARCLRSWTRAA
jgi:hypothetical protein